MDTMLPVGQLLTLGLQHVLAMYAGAVAVPLIIGSALGLSQADIGYLVNADLLICGVATLIQCLGVWRFGVRMPLMQGCSFAALTPMVLIGTKGGGLPAIYGAVIASGLLVTLLAPYFSRLVRLFPPLVVGTIAVLIGVSLLPVAVNWAAGGSGAADFGAPRHLALALGVLALVLAAGRYLPGFFGKNAVLLGIVLGTLVAIPLGFTSFSSVRDAPLIGISTPFHFGLPTFSPAAIVSLVVVMLVVMTETSGSILTIGEMVGKPVDRRVLADGLRADGLSTLLGGVFNTFPYTAYGQNIGLLGLTGVRSRYVVATGGAILVVLGLTPVLGQIVAAIPPAVLGGAGLVMFGSVAAGGIRTLSRVSFTGNANLLVVAVALGVGLAPIGAPHIYDQFPAWFQNVMQSGISAGSLTAVLLNLLFNRFRVAADEPAPPAMAQAEGSAT
ncbi:uracil permease [Longimycelium tulufanense]|uniref:Uracil permease n=1 Tax=Longimycelium tulufanense TaxID=907463 RepID=A0A8J3C620_9PSEU|nr:uracil permease [Longimycelium tulufanense]